MWLGEGNKSFDLTITSFLSGSKQPGYPSLEFSAEGFDLPANGLKLLANAIAWCIVLVIVKPIILFCCRVRRFSESYSDQLLNLIWQSI
jgi:hypothetical protein